MKFASKLIGVGLAVTTFGAFGGTAEAAATWQLWQTDADGCYDIATWDGNWNGSPEDAWLDHDNDCLWDVRLYDADGHDGVRELASFDMNENGRPEQWIYSSAGTDGWSFRDYNEDGIIDSTQYFSVPTYTYGVIGGTNSNLVNTAVTMRTADSGAFAAINTMALHTGRACWSVSTSCFI